MRILRANDLYTVETRREYLNSSESKHQVAIIERGPTMTTQQTNQSEIDDFVKDRPREALDYLKLLKEEISKTNQSRTWYTYITWLLVATFFLLDTNSAQVHIQVFERIDPALIQKILPAATFACYYTMLTRYFILRERIGIFDEIANRIFPSKLYPYSIYIMPIHFMLAERLLNRNRPKNEVLSINAMLAVIILVTIYSPAAFAIFEYVLIVRHYGFYDRIVIASLAVGVIFAIQALVIKRGWDASAKDERIRIGKIHPKSSINMNNTSDK